MPKNRVKQIYESGQAAFGTNVAIPSRSSSKWPRKPPHLRSIDNYHVRGTPNRWRTWSAPATTRTSRPGFAAATIPGSS